MKSDLTFEIEQMLKEANGGVQMKPSHIQIDLKEWDYYNIAFSISIHFDYECCKNVE